MNNQDSTSNLTCNFCNKKFSNTYNLKKHIAAAKVCISKRPETKVEIVKFPCEFCKKVFTLKYNLEFHIQNCKERKEWTVEVEKEEIIEKYDKKLEKISAELEKEKDAVLELELILQKANKRNRKLELQLAKNEGKIEILKTTRPKRVTINNNYINPKLAKISTEGLPFLTREYIENLAHNYTYDHFMQGSSGIAQFFKECVVLPPLQLTNGENEGEIGDIIEDVQPRIMYPCTDSARQKFYKHEDTGWTLDIGAPFLSTAIDALKETSREHYSKLCDLCFKNEDEMMGEIYDDERKKLILPMIQGINAKKGHFRNKLISDVRVHLRPHVSI